MMATPKTVELTYNAVTHALTPNHSSLTLQSPEDWVTWKLHPNSPMPPPNASLLIRFEQHLGPFQTLRGNGTQTIIATGNKGDSSSTSYSYFLYLLLDPAAPSHLIKSGPFTIVNDVSGSNPSPWVHVTYDPENEQVTIEPTTQPLLLHEGDVPLVKFTDVPNDFLVAFWFSGFSSANGPFSSYFVTRENGQGTVRLGGATFGLTEAPTIEFHVRVWNADGHLVATDDPSIDNLGRPPG